MAIQIPDNFENTQATCVTTCVAMGYNVAGVEYGVQCFCGDYLYNGAVQAPAGDCNARCPGNNPEACGGGNRINVFSSVELVAYGVPGPKTTGFDADWSYRGCYDDNVLGIRTFAYPLSYEGELTPNTCLDGCAEAGFTAAGLEYGGQCFCGSPDDVEAHDALLHPDSACDVICDGDPGSYCGGGNLLSTYFLAVEETL